MQIAREYWIDLNVHYKLSLFDEDIKGETEAEIVQRVEAMAWAATNSKHIQITRLWMPDVLDLNTITDDELRARVQDFIDERKIKEAQDDRANS